MTAQYFISAISVHAVLGRGMRVKEEIERAWVGERE